MRKDYQQVLHTTLSLSASARFFHSLPPSSPLLCSSAPNISMYHTTLLLSCPHPTHLSLVEPNGIYNTLHSTVNVS